MKFSVLMQVYNEERCLPCSLRGLLPVVDEVVIVDGGPYGPSTDKTADIVDHYKCMYPDKIKYLAGTYLRDDLAWDEMKQLNDGLARVTGDYVMRTAADVVYDQPDVQMVRDIVERFPGKKYFYCPIIDFGGDTDHIILEGRTKQEESLVRELCSPEPAAVVSMDVNFRAVEIGADRRFGTVADIDYNRDILYMPHVKRYHYAYVKPFAFQVEKYIRLIYKKDHGDHKRLKEAGEPAMVKEAIEWTRNLKDTLPVQPYTGLYPVNGEPLRSMHVMEGYDEFIDQLTRNPSRRFYRV